MIQNAIRNYGGKNGMANEILKYFPDPTTYNTYIEPFSGSYSLGIRLNPPPINEIYNDLDGNLYSLYKVLGDNELFPLFKEKCDIYPYSEDFRTEFKIKLKDDNISIVDRAFYYFYINRTSHNGIGGLSINLVHRRKMAKSVSDFLSAVDGLEEIHQRLSKVIVLNRDGIKLIEKYNNDDTFLYCDPPYHQSTRTSARYPTDMNNDQQIDFLDTVIRSKSKILISGYDCQEYGVLESNGFTKIDFEVKTMGGDYKPKTKIESLWKNY